MPRSGIRTRVLAGALLIAIIDSLLPGVGARVSGSRVALAADYALSYPWTLGRIGYEPFTDLGLNIATGDQTLSAADLVLPGRLLPLVFERFYNSADDRSGPFGPGWTHSLNGKITVLSGTQVEVRGGDGRRDVFTKSGSTWSAPEVFDTLVQNGDGSFTYTLKDQTAYEFSSAGTLTRIHEPAGNQITLAYTGANLTTVTDAVGRQVALSYDGSNRITALQDPLGRRVTYAYDGGGRLSSMVDKIGNTTGQNPAQHTWQYTYDGASSHVRTLVDPDGRTRFTDTYDASGRVTSQADALGASTTLSYTVFAYQECDEPPCGPPIPAETYVTDRRGHGTRYYFDYQNAAATNGRMRLTQRYPDAGGGVLWYYDGSGNVTTFYDPLGNVTSYTPGGRLATVHDWLGNTTTYTYTPAGRTSHIQFPGSLTADYAYDRAGRLTQIAYKAGATTLTSETYTLDAEGNRTALAEFVSGLTAPGATDTYAFGYDWLSRLTSASGPGITETFTYDAASNITARTGPSATNTLDGANRLLNDGAKTYSWNNADQLTQRAANGCAAGRYVDMLEYDAIGQLRTSFLTTDGTACSTTPYAQRNYHYDADGLLRLALWGGTEVRLRWDLTRSIPAPLQVGTDTIVSGLAPLYAIRADGSLTVLARDGIGSVRAELTIAGSATRSFRYAAYGTLAQSSGGEPSRLGYAGQYLDPNGLYYMRARWYDPLTARFMTRDPLNGDPSAPISLNGYAYGGGNPVSRVDSTGLDPVLDAGGIDCGQSCFVASGPQDPGVGCQVVLCNVAMNNVPQTSRTTSPVALCLGGPVAVCGMNFNKTDGASSNAPTGPSSGGSSKNRDQNAGKTIAEILRTRDADIYHKELPKGTPSLADLRDGGATWDDVLRGAKENQTGYKTLKKILLDGRWRK